MGEFPYCGWNVQGVEFVSILKVLSLVCYDRIVDMDWLELHNPMTVHWCKKTMSFHYQGKRIVLRGMRIEAPQCFMEMAQPEQTSWETPGQLFAAELAKTDMSDTV